MDEKFNQLNNFLLNGDLPPDEAERKKIRRMAPNFTIKDSRLFYTGPSQKYMRLVILTVEEKITVLKECHNNPGTGNHNGFRGTRNRVNAGYYWASITQDVQEWVRSCHRCQLNDPIKTVPPPLHPIQVKECWEVLGLDLIGPLTETGRGNKYILTMTDLYSKWVIAEPLKSKTAAEVSAIITSKLYTFGMVRKIITDQGKEFVNQLNDSIFSMLKIQHAVSSAYHPQTNGQDERTNQNIKRTLRKYVNSSHNDWDLHLAAVVYGINTAKQSSTKHTPYFLLFHRHPHLPAVLNACPMADDFEVGNPEDTIDQRVQEMATLSETILHNIGKAQSSQKKAFSNRKRKLLKECIIQAGDDVLLTKDTKRKCTGDALSSHHQGPYKVASITCKGVATIVKHSATQRVNVSRLRNYYRPQNPQSERHLVLDHTYNMPQWKIDHQYASPGAKWITELGPDQSSLLKYVLDQKRPSGEILVKQGKICLTREDFWSLGLGQCMDSNIGNACLKIVEENAKRHGKDVYIEDLYVVPTWKDKDANMLRGLPQNLRSKDILLFPAWSRSPGVDDHYLLCAILVAEKQIYYLDSLRPDGFGDDLYRTIFRQVAAFINPGPWIEKTGRDLEFFPQQSTGNSCGIFMLMYALSICTSTPMAFTEEEMPLIRQWWCIKLMEKFGTEGYGQRLAFWTDEASQLLRGALEPVFRVPRSAMVDSPCVL